MLCLFKTTADNKDGKITERNSAVIVNKLTHYAAMIVFDLIQSILEHCKLRG